MSDSNFKGKVLVLDDEEMVGEITCHMLNHLGYKTTLVREGSIAVAQYQQQLLNGTPFDLVIMDLVVPTGIGGKEAAEAILAMDPDAKIVASSGFSSDPVMTDFTEYGFTGTLQKPFDLELLEKTLQSSGPLPA